MIYTVTASYGQYSDRCDIPMYTTADLDEARVVMFELQASIVATMDIITVDGHGIVTNCSEAIWNVASGAHWEGTVDITIHSMKMGVVSYGATFVEKVVAESTSERFYNRDVYDYTGEEEPGMSKYEMLALPYEDKYNLSGTWK